MLKGNKKREWQRKWLASRRAQWFLGKACVWCGSKNNLELDHIDPKTKVTHRIWSWSVKRFRKEAKKCQVLCRPCHLKKTQKDMGYGLKHGTPAGYNYYSCRCRPCKTAGVKRVLAWRARCA